MPDLDFLIERRILKLGNQLLNHRNDDLKRFNLTAEQSEALLFFNAHEGAILFDLKEHLGISHQATRNIVERMKKKDLLYAEVSPEDARARKIFLTNKGHEICNTLELVGTGVGRKLLNGITEDERKILFFLLDQMTRNMSG